MLYVAPYQPKDPRLKVATLINMRSSITASMDMNEMHRFDMLPINGDYFHRCSAFPGKFGFVFFS